jgi:hypothetical protein
MIEGALKADGRIAAKNAVKIRAALHQVTDFKRVFDKYQETQPQPTDNTTQDRVRARSWIILNVYLNDEPLRQTVMRAWAEAYVLGQAAAGEWIAKAERANKADDIEVNWDKWQPGDKATALLIKPTKGFNDYLTMVNADSYFKKFNKETIENLGTALSDSIAAGLDAESAAIMIGRHVASPSRALTIAITEQNRAMSFGSIQRYKEAELTQMEWAVSDPCDRCAQNDGQVILIGQAFASGDRQPPAHPHCRCVLLPVIPGFEEAPEMPGATMVVPPSPVDFGPDAATTMLPVPKSEEFVPGQWLVLSRAEIRTAVIDRYLRGNPAKTRAEIADYVDRGRIDKPDLSLIKNGTIVQNGPIEVQFYSTGAKLAEPVKQNVLKIVEKLQMTNPKERVVIAIGSESSGKRGWALLGGERLWITPATARFLTPNASDVGFKMPVLAKVSQAEYTLAHEWGHLIDRGGGFNKKGVSFQAPLTVERIVELKREFPDAFKSTYSAENTKEFYAEMFTEYWNSGGLTDNPLVQAMAKEFKWKALDVPKPVIVYTPAKKPFDYFTREKAESFYASAVDGKINYGSYNVNGQNLYLKNLLEEQGFNGKPKVVGADEFKKYVDQGSVPIYRGIAGDTAQDVDSYVTQLLQGDAPFIGKGMFGDGTYFATNREIAEAFTKETVTGEARNVGKVVEGILDPQAKVITLQELRRLEDEIWPNGHGDYPQDFYEDPSALAASLGYDAIKMERPKLSWTPDAQPVDADYIVVLNRTALILKEMP